MPLKSIPENFGEAVEQFGGDTKRAAWQLLSLEATMTLGRNVAHDHRTDELVVLVDPWPVGEAPPITPPDAGQIETIIDQAVSRFGIPEADKPRVTGARVQPYVPALIVILL